MQKPYVIQVGKEKVDLKGGPEAVAERLVKETDGMEIKKIELEKKHAEIVPGEAGSGVERGSAASAAQVSRSWHEHVPLACV